MKYNIETIKIKHPLKEGMVFFVVGIGFWKFVGNLEGHYRGTVYPRFLSPFSLCSDTVILYYSSSFYFSLNNY